MKKIMRCALLFSLTVLLCTACEKGEPDELLQTEHVPGKEEAVVHTPTPIPSPTEGATPTATKAPTLPLQEEEELVTQAIPLPTLPAEEPEFMDMYRAMPAGIRIDTEGVSEEEIRFCFCNMEISDQTQTAFSGQADVIWTDIQRLAGVRVLYYRNDGKPYICDVIADEAECEMILSTFYQMYQKEVKIEDLMYSLPDALSSQGYRAGTLSAGSVQYLYLYKYIYK